MDIVEKIRQFVEAECQKPTSKYGVEPYEFHFVPMVKCASFLCDKLGGDKEVILLAAWLHDIGTIMEGREEHHLSGAKIAEKTLLDFGYDLSKIELIKKCILNHRGSISGVMENLEEKIISEADALSNFDNISGMFAAAYKFENLNQGEAKKSVMKKIENKWRKLQFEESRDMVRARYDAAKVLFG